MGYQATRPSSWSPRSMPTPLHTPGATITYGAPSATVTQSMTADPYSVYAPQGVAYGTPTPTLTYAAPPDASQQAYGSPQPAMTYAAPAEPTMYATANDSVTPQQVTNPVAYNALGASVQSGVAYGATPTYNATAG